ncbi:MAG TPA: acetylglutamate kinase [bacterium]|nr:acetylglutamate kinase [bacterium]HPN30572.1 acetylglutamate kinase [bacterium]
MKNEINIAEILIESLPYIKKFFGQTLVIKYGGHAMADENLKKSFAEDITLLKYIGINPVIVHGGGPQIGEYLKKLNIKSSFIEGMRITDGPTMDVVEMVLVGKVNKEIVALINKAGGKAIGFSGKDGGLIEAEKMTILKESSDEQQPPEILDIGLVGKIKKINRAPLDMIVKNEFIPVISPVGFGANGETFNINADLVTSAIAAAMKAYRTIFLSDIQGVLDKDGGLLSQLNSSKIDECLKSGVITGGMIPKIKSCLELLDAGVERVHIIDGRIPHSILLELFTNKGIGTLIRK